MPSATTTACGPRPSPSLHRQTFRFHYGAWFAFLTHFVWSIRAAPAQPFQAYPHLLGSHRRPAQQPSSASQKLVHRDLIQSLAPSAASPSAQRVQTSFTLVAQTDAAANGGPGLSCPQNITYELITAYSGLVPQNPNATINAALYRNILVDGQVCADSNSPATSTVFVDLSETPANANPTSVQPFFLRGTDQSPRVCGNYQPANPYFYYFTDNLPRFQELLVSMLLIPPNNSALLAALPTDVYMMAQPYFGGKMDGSLISTAVCTFRAPSTFVNASTTPVPSPSPSAAANGTTKNNTAAKNNSNSCFPASAIVTSLVGGSEIALRMDSLSVGDRIVSYPAMSINVWHPLYNRGRSGAPVRRRSRVISDVFLFTHRLHSVQALFLELRTDTNATITLSPGHYIATHPRGFIPADAVIPWKDRLIRGSDGVHVMVTGVRSVVKHGLFAPHTMDGRIVVDGFVASTYTRACPPALAHSLLAPLRVLYKLAGVTVGNAFDAGVEAYFLRWFFRAIRRLNSVLEPMASSSILGG